MGSKARETNKKKIQRGLKAKAEYASLEKSKSKNIKLRLRVSDLAHKDAFEHYSLSLFFIQHNFLF